MFLENFDIIFLQETFGEGGKITQVLEIIFPVCLLICKNNKVKFGGLDVGFNQRAIRYMAPRVYNYP